MTHEERANAILKNIASTSVYFGIGDKKNIAYLTRHFEELIKEEREACAKIVDKYTIDGEYFMKSIAQTIRSRV